MIDKQTLTRYSSETEANLKSVAAGVGLTLGVQREVLLRLQELISEIEYRNQQDTFEDWEKHVEAWMDTGDGYSVDKGYRIRCEWCPWETMRVYKVEALAEYQKHEDRIRELYAEHHGIERS